MEEILDNAGQHGWKLISVTSENHFYAFYFIRPLLSHKLQTHRDRLHGLITQRLNKEAAHKATINKTLNSK